MTVHFLTSNLYGRKSELSLISDVYHRVCNDTGSSEFILVHGHSGTGKSSLVKYFLRTIISKPNVNDEKINKTFVVSGKFDQLHKTEPYSALSSALSNLCDLIIKCDEYKMIQKSVKEAIGLEEGRVLWNVIPKLRDILISNEYDESDTSKGQKDISHLVVKERKENDAFDPAMINQFKCLLRSFIRSVCCCSTHPIVLFLDDLQWIDTASLDVIKNLATDKESKHLLIIGTHRDDDNDEMASLRQQNRSSLQPTSPSAPCSLQQTLVEIENKNIFRVTNIKLGNFDIETLNEFLSENLNMKEDKTACKPLSSAIHRRTDGNIFFVLQFLDMLQDEDFLRCKVDPHDGTPQWEWDIERINSCTDFSENVVQCTLSMIHKLPIKAQSILKIASCLGAKFDVDTLMESILSVRDCNCHAAIRCRDKKTNTKDQEDMKEFIPTSKDELFHILEENLERFVRKSQRTKTQASSSDMNSGGYYRFTHDRIQQASYSLINNKIERDMLHCCIGERLYQIYERNGGDESGSQMIFVVVDQLNRASDRITSNEDAVSGCDNHYHQEDNKRQKLIELAELNLRAGEKAVSLSAFFPAVDYFQMGIDLIGQARCDDDDTSRDIQLWEKENYKLNLRLHSALAEMFYCNGDFVKSMKVAEIVLNNARSLDDKVRAYITLVLSLGAQERLEEATDVCFDILNRLGEQFPSPSSRHRSRALFLDLMKTRKMLEGRTDEDLLALPKMKSREKTIAMNFLRALALYSFFLTTVDTLTLVSCRMVQLSLQFGLSDVSSYGFALYGMILCGDGTSSSSSSSSSLLPSFLRNNSNNNARSLKNNNNNLNEGYRYGRLSLKLLNKFHDTQNKIEAGVIDIVYLLVNHWKDPLPDSLDPLLKSYQTGMMIGDIEHALLSASDYSAIYFCCGMPLGPIAKDLESYCRLMEEYKQDLVLGVTLPIQWTILTLMGEQNDDDQPAMFGSVISKQSDHDNNMGEEGTTIREKTSSKDKNHDMASLFMDSCNLFVAYYFGDLELAEKMLKKVHNSLNILVSHFFIIRLSFFSGLVSLEIYHTASKTKNRKRGLLRMHKKQALKTIQKFEHWTKNGTSNCFHMLLLLRAEWKQMKGGGNINNNSDSNNNKKKKRAAVVKEAYDMAIATAGRTGFMQDKALANERAGIFYFKEGGTSDDHYYWASYYLSNAYDLYQEWGAHAKADSLFDEYSNLIVSRKESGRREEVLGFRGRARFMDITKLYKRVSLG